ncbi:MAG: hypothetical protein H7145_04675 [Akkermansiaceae bacterium]|nr:hypothetical protein [Armatimonadota bacterium]
MKQPLAFRNIGMMAVSLATLLGGAALNLVTSGVAHAQVASPPTVTLDVKDAPIREVLEKVLRAAGVDFAIDPAVRGSITVKMRDIPFENALKLIMQSSTPPLTYYKNGVYVFKLRTATTTEPSKPAETKPRSAPVKSVPLPTVTIDLQNAPIRPALEQIFRTANVDFAIDPVIQGTVTIKTNDVPFEKALRLILRSATTPFTYTKEDGVYRVKPGTLPEDPTPVPAPQPAAQPVPLPDLTLDFKDTPIRAALEEIFRLAKVDFGIDPSVQGYVNLKVTDMPFENALKLILRSSATPLTYSKDGGVYIVKPRTVSLTTPAPPVVARETTEALPRPEYDRIELTYADPVDLAQLLNITMIPIGTRFGLKVPGATGIIGPGGPGRGGNAGSGLVGGGAIVGSGNGPSGNGIVGF